MLKTKIYDAFPQDGYKVSNPSEVILDFYNNIYINLDSWDGQKGHYEFLTHEQTFAKIIAAVAEPIGIGTLDDSFRIKINDFLDINFSKQDYWWVHEVIVRSETEALEFLTKGLEMF